MEQQGLLEDSVSKEGTAEGTVAPDDNELECHGIVFERKIAVWQVTIRLPLDRHPLNLIALSYGFLPFLIPALFVVEIIACASTTRHVHMFAMYALFICLFCFILNEFILKPILKQPRPKKTANKYPDGTIKPGMPSGHVYNASALMVWLLCEVVGSGPGYEQKHLPTFFSWLALILVLMGPVPWARVYNYDHTVNQCLVSSGLGLITGICAFFLRRHFLGGWCEPWSAEGWSDCPDASSVHSHTTKMVVPGALGAHFLRGKDPDGARVFSFFGIVFG